jgi:hypothetical protein
VHLAYLYAEKDFQLPVQLQGSLPCGSGPNRNSNYRVAGVCRRLATKLELVVSAGLLDGAKGASISPRDTLCAEGNTV